MTGPATSPAEPGVPPHGPPHGPPGAPPGAGGRRKQLALIAAIMGSFVAGLDATAVNVALPAIRADLGGGLAGQQWVSNAYLLALGSLILVGGSLGDIFGERRVFSIGVAGFGLVSLLCAAAPDIGILIAGRALEGAFGALLTPSALAVIVAAFPREERGAAISRPALGAAAHSSDAAPKPATPAAKTRRRPRMSPSEPPTRSSDPSVSR